MKETTTPSVLLRVKEDLSECVEVRVALTRDGEDTPAVIKKLSDLTVSITDSGVAFTLTQEDTNKLANFAVIDMRAKFSDGTVIGYKPGYLRIGKNFDRVII